MERSFLHVEAREYNKSELSIGTKCDKSSASKFGTAPANGVDIQFVTAYITHSAKLISLKFGQCVGSFVP